MISKKHRLKRNVMNDKKFIDDINNINILLSPRKSTKIGKCFAPGGLLLNPISMMVIGEVTENFMYPVIPYYKNKVHINFECCDGYTNSIVMPEDVENYDPYDNMVILPESDYEFLSEIYGIKTYELSKLYLENDIDNKPSLTKKRILNSMYIVYKNNDMFPCDKYIELIKNILFNTENIVKDSETIFKDIMENKYKKDWNNIFSHFIYQ